MELKALRWRLAHVFSEGPFLFLAIVLGIAVLFRLAIGWAKG